MSREICSGFLAWCTDRLDIDPHQELGVLETATDEEIRKQYRNLAKKYHPDVCKLPDAQQRFLRVQKAYNMIKDEEAREKSKVDIEYGDVFEGVNLDQIPKEEREIIVVVLNKIRDRKSIIEGFTAAIAFEISAMRNHGSDYLMSAFSVREKLPQFVSLTCEDSWSVDKDNLLKFNVFSRMEDQNAIGKITYNTMHKEAPMRFESRDDKLVATASIMSRDTKTLSRTDTFVVKSEGRVVGTFSSTYWPLFPVFSSQSILLPGKNSPPVEGTRFCFFGSRMVWSYVNRENSTKICAVAQRELVSTDNKI